MPKPILSIDSDYSDDHTRGPADAPLTIVQYGDYDCPHTRASTSIVHAVERELSMPIRFVFRHFPLRHLHPNAQLLAEIAQASATLGHFWEVHERLMARRRNLSQRDVMDDLGASKLDVAAIQALLGSAAIVARVERDVDTGKASGVHSTPTWFFNGLFWDGHYDEATLMEQAKRALQA